MPKQCCAILGVFLLLSGSPIQAHRIATVDDHMSTETITDTHAMSWGRSCESLQTRFQNQQTLMVQSEGMRSVLVTVSFLRTLRRANARSCDWVHDPNIDMSALRQVASTQLQQGRCYGAASATVEAAQDLSEDEREVVSRNAMLILLSESDDCSITEDLDDGFNPEPEDEMEEALDEDTDLIYAALSEERSSSLLQEEVSPFANTIMPIMMRLGGMIGGYTGVDLATFAGMFILMIIWGMLCGFLMEFIRRAIRWIKCGLTRGGETCFGAPPATWFRYIVRGGCAVIGGLYGLGDAFGWSMVNHR